MSQDYDFSGWATKSGVRCADGRTIMHNAFQANHGKQVPLVWNHQHNDPTNILGHALLENRGDGVYAYCKFNNTESGQAAKESVMHGDINALSIYANNLEQSGPRNNRQVHHGLIREVSLVLAGANPTALIDSVIAHGDNSEDDAIIALGDPLFLEHSDDYEEDDYEEYDDEEYEDDYDDDDEEYEDDYEEDDDEDYEYDDDEYEEDDEDIEHGNITVGQVIDSMSPLQQEVMFMVANEIAGDTNYQEDYEDMQHNLFDSETMENNDDFLSHSEMQAIFSDGKRNGSLKDAVIQHGIEDIEWLFPEDHNLNPTPRFIDRDKNWVAKVMNGVHHSPFARIKSTFADLREDEARAKGYIKGKYKKEEFFSLLKRSTSPTTVYKKQKLDRDDVIDITDFDVVAWLKGEMRGKLDEEIARAILIGDGRLTSDDDHINENNIRPIYNDEDLFTIKGKVNVANNATNEDIARAFIKQAIRSQEDYMGSGNLTCFMAKSLLTEILLLTDTTGRDLYADVSAVAKKLGVDSIVTVPYLKTQKGVDGGDLLAIMVDLDDYNVGADKGGSVNMFDDFDIDFNQMKYLIETRCSGALTVPYSAIALELKRAA